MRSFLKLHLIAATVLFFVAGSAHAWTFSWTPDTTSINAGDPVTIDIFLTSDGPQDSGIQLLGLGILTDGADNMGALQYDEPASSVPDYLLYSPGNGTVPSAYLVPSQSPPTFWPAPPSGQTEVIVNWQEVTLISTNVLASNTLIATLVYRGGAGFNENASVSMILDGFGTIFRTCTPLTDQDCGNVVATLAPDLSIEVPEPAVSGLSLAAIGTLVALRRWRRDA